MKSSRSGPALAILLLLAGSVAASQEAAIDHQTLLEKHLQWRGGRAAIERIESMIQKGTISVAGMEGTIAMTARRDGRRRVEYDLGVFKGLEVTLPDGGWEINPSGQVEDMGTNEVQRNLLMNEADFGQHLLEGSSYEIKDGGEMRHDGRDWRVVRLTAPNGDTQDLLIDPKDGSLTWTRTVADTDTVWTKQSDWRVVEGVRQPFRIESQHRIAMENQRIELRSVEINVDVDETVFERPQDGRRLASFRQGKPEWTPIRLYLGRYIYIVAEVNGHPTELLLDTGAGMTVLDAAFATEIGVTGDGALPAVGTGGAVEASIVNGLRIAVGNLELDELTAAVVDLKELVGRFGMEIPVILGKEVFHNVIVDLDYPNARIAFRKQENFAYSGAGTAVELIPDEDGHKQILAQVEDLPPARFTLDTGAGGTLTLFKRYAEAHNLLDTRQRISDAAGGGVGGVTVQRISTLRSFTLGGYELNDVPVDFHVTTAVGAFDTKDTAGNLGAQILKRFRIVFDYANNVAYFEPGPDWQSSPFPRNRTGLGAYPTDHGFEVLHVATGSPAEQGGWRTGDRIVAVNNEPVGRDMEAWQRWMQGEAGTDLILRDGDGKDRKLTLADYY